MKNNINIVGIVASKYSGKDTIADYLIANKEFTKYSFADPIKYGAMAMFGFTKEQMWGTDKDKETIDPRWGISPRKMLQLMGTELFQYDIHKYLNEGEFPVGREVWVYRFKLWVEELKNSETDKIFGSTQRNIVIADCRFPHEAKVIKEMGGEIWRIKRPSLISTDTHGSEIELEEIIPDNIIINDGSLEDLYRKIDELL